METTYSFIQSLVDRDEIPKLQSIEVIQILVSKGYSTTDDLKRISDSDWENIPLKPATIVVIKSALKENPKSASCKHDQNEAKLSKSSSSKNAEPQPTSPRKTEKDKKDSQFAKLKRELSKPNKNSDPNPKLKKENSEGSKTSKAEKAKLKKENSLKHKDKDKNNDPAKSLEKDEKPGKLQLNLGGLKSGSKESPSSPEPKDESSYVISYSPRKAQEGQFQAKKPQNTEAPATLRLSPRRNPDSSDKNIDSPRKNADSSDKNQFKKALSDPIPSPRSRLPDTPDPKTKQLSPRPKQVPPLPLKPEPALSPRTAEVSPRRNIDKAQISPRGLVSTKPQAGALGTDQTKPKLPCPPIESPKAKPETFICSLCKAPTDLKFQKLIKEKLLCPKCHQLVSAKLEAKQKANSVDSLPKKPISIEQKVAHPHPQETKNKAGQLETPSPSKPSHMEPKVAHHHQEQKNKVETPSSPKPSHTESKLHTEHKNGSEKNRASPGEEKFECELCHMPHPISRRKQLQNRSLCFGCCKLLQQKMEEKFKQRKQPEVEPLTTTKTRSPYAQIRPKGDAVLLSQQELLNEVKSFKY